MAIEKLVPGMLLLDHEGSTGGRSRIWTVKSPRVLVSHSEGITIHGNLGRKGKGIPQGMVLLDNTKLAADLKNGRHYAVSG